MISGHEGFSSDSQDLAGSSWDSVAALANHSNDHNSEQKPAFDIDDWLKKILPLIDEEGDYADGGEDKVKELVNDFKAQVTNKNIDFHNSDIIEKLAAADIDIGSLLSIGVELSDFNATDIKDSLIHSSGYSMGDLCQKSALKYIEEAGLVDDEFKNNFNIKEYIERGYEELFSADYDEDYNTLDSLNEIKIKNIIEDLSVCSALGGDMISNELIDGAKNCIKGGHWDSREIFTSDQFKNLIAKPLVEKEIINPTNLSKIYRGELNEKFQYEGLSRLISESVKAGMKVEDDDPEVRYWHDLSIAKGTDAIDDFRSVRLWERESKYNLDDFYAIKRCIDDRVPYDEMMTDKWRKRLSDPRIQNLVLAKGNEINKKQGDNFWRKDYRERGAWRALFANRDIVLSMSQYIDLGQYGALCSGIPEFEKLKDGNFLEKDRLMMFLESHHTEIGDECFTDSGEPNLQFFYAICNKFPGIISDRVLDAKELNITQSAKILSRYDYMWGNKPQDVQEKYFDESGSLRPEFWQERYNQKDLQFFYRLPDEVLDKSGLSERQLSIMSILNEYPSSIVLQGDMQDIQEKYFDESGNLNANFWQESFQHRDTEVFRGISAEVLKNSGFSDKQMAALEVISKTKSRIANYVIDNFDQLQADQIERISTVFDRVDNSNSYEVCRGSENLVFILSAKEPSEAERALAKIESIFLKNNLPYVGKVFNTFDMLFLRDSMTGLSMYPMNRGDLKDRSVDGLRGKKAILWNDLLKCAIGSGSNNLLTYLDSLSDGEKILQKATNGEDPQSSERDSLEIYVNHLITLYNQTQKSEGRAFDASGNLIEDAKGISKLISAEARYSVPDRIVRSFGFGLGIHSVKDLRTRIEIARKDADARNRERAEKGDFRLVSGDILKATGVEYLGSILRNGSVSKEFLNGQAASDSTPLDTDVNVISDDTIDGSIGAAIEWKNRVAQFGSMHCLIALKGDNETGRSRFKKEGEARYDPNKYEIWQNSGNNQGIRVGFPSSEIDFLIHDRRDQTDTHGDLERMKFEVARNGFYIPIVDKDSGQCVFMPDEYDNLRKRFGGISEYGTGEFNFASYDEMLSPAFSIGEKTIPSVSDLVESLNGNEEEVDRKRNAILNEAIKPAFAELGLEYRDQIDGNITTGNAQFIDTGSTGRGDNVPGDGDFDFMMKIDRSTLLDPDKMWSIREKIAEKLGTSDPGGNFRKVKYQTTNGDEVEIDITFAQKTNKVGFSTDMALKQRLQAIKKQDPARAKEVTANIIYAKQFFKSIDAYKPKHARENPQGGMGGIGVENWILNNGGSFINAARDFMSVAKDRDYYNFCEAYGVFDFGENHGRSGQTDDADTTIGTTDNFIVNNMDAGGYARIKDALNIFLKSLSKN